MSTFDTGTIVKAVGGVVAGYTGHAVPFVAWIHGRETAQYAAKQVERGFAANIRDVPLPEAINPVNWSQHNQLDLVMAVCGGLIGSRIR